MKNWEVKKLGDVCSFFNGQAHEKCIDENGKYKLINSKFVSSEGENFKRTNSALSPLFVNDIVMVMSDVPNGKTLAKCFIVDKDDTYTLNQRICVIRSKNFDTRFLYYQLNRNKYLLSFDNGENQSNLRKDDILNCELFVPPLAEQKRIVATLDEAFAALGKAKANAEQNLKNSKEIFESYLNGVFENKGKDWEEKTLGEVTNVQRGSSPRPKGDPKYFSQTETEYNWITISDISSYCENNVLLQTSEWLTEVGSKQSRYVDKNEFIIAVSGSTTGKCCITGIKGFIYDGLAVVKIINNTIEPKFLLNYMISLYTTINNSKTGAAFPNINTNYLNNLPFPFPPLKEQKIIVQKLDALSTETKRLEAIYQTKINDLEELKKSVLQKAFSGELKTAKALV